MKRATEIASNFVATINGHDIYRSDDGKRCNLWTAGVGWWGFDLSEESARRVAESVEPVCSKGSAS